MIDTDTRQLRRNSDGEFYTGAGKKLCSHCGDFESCDVAMKPDVKFCDMFLPAIPFQTELGLDRPSNTVRVGVAWTQRLHIGQKIALYNSNTKKIFGHSIVTALHSGHIDLMLADHAHNNHLMLDEPRETAAEALHKWQKQNYGPRIIHEATKITAIYLQRVGEQNAATDHQGDEARRVAEGGAESPGQDHGDGNGHPLPGGGAEGSGHLARPPQEPS